MKLVNISLLAAGLATAYSASASAWSCDALISEMKAMSDAGHKTKLIVTSHQANGVSSFSGHDPNGLTYYPGVVLERQGDWMVTASGRLGHMEFSDRSWYNSPYFQHYSAKYKDAAALFVNLSPWLISMTYVPHDVPIHNVDILNPQCENGLIWGLGTPVGDNNGSNRALWVFSYSYE